MRSLSSAFVAAAVLLLVGSPRAETIYSWTDSSGEVHYTDDPGTIPESKRSKTRVTEEPDAEPALPSPPPVPRRSDSSASDRAAEKAREASWRQRFRAARERLARLEESVAADRRMVQDPASQPVNRQAHGGVLPSAEYEAARERLKRSETDLAQAREALADLERQAAREAIPFEWRR